MLRNKLIVLVTLAVSLSVFSFANVRAASVEPTASVEAKAGHYVSFPTCLNEYPLGFFEPTSAYAYITTDTTPLSSSEHPGEWSCDQIWYHTIRINWITSWNPFSTQYPGRGPIFVKAAKWTPTVFDDRAYSTTDTYLVNGVQEVLHYFGNTKVFYFSASKTDMKLEKFVNGTPVEIDLATLEYRKVLAFAFGRDPICDGVDIEAIEDVLSAREYRYFCRLTHSFKTDNLSAGTYRLTFTDTYTPFGSDEPEPPASYLGSFPGSYADSTPDPGPIPSDPYTPDTAPAASVNGFYQSFFYLTK